MSHTGAVEVIPAEAIAAIVAEIEPSSTVVDTSDLPGGLSSWMTLVEVERPDGSRHQLVVRRGRRPDAERYALSFGAEFELIRHLHTCGIPVARPRAFDDSGRILPQSYVVLDFVQGTTRFTTDDPAGRAIQMADVLAAVHDLDATSASLPLLPLHTDRMQGWVITDLARREPDPYCARTWSAATWTSTGHHRQPSCAFSTPTTFPATSSGKAKRLPQSSIGSRRPSATRWPTSQRPDSTCAGPTALS